MSKHILNNPKTTPCLFFSFASFVTSLSILYEEISTLNLFWPEIVLSDIIRTTEYILDSTDKVLNQSNLMKVTIDFYRCLNAKYVVK